MKHFCRVDIRKVIFFIDYLSSIISYESYINILKFLLAKHCIYFTLTSIFLLMKKFIFLHILLLIGVLFTLMTQTESQVTMQWLPTRHVDKMIVRVIWNKHDDVKLFFFLQPLCTAMRRAGFVQRNSHDWCCDEALVALFDFACYFSPFFSCLRLLSASSNATSN